MALGIKPDHVLTIFFASPASVEIYDIIYYSFLLLEWRSSALFRNCYSEAIFSDLGRQRRGRRSLVGCPQEICSW